MLSVNFNVDSVLEEALKSLHVKNGLIRAIVITVEDEIMKLHLSPLESTDQMDEDLCKLRESMRSDHLDAAFVIVKLEEGKFSLVSYCAESTKPKIRMLYASGVHHLTEVSGVRYMSKATVECVDEIVPSLFAKEKGVPRECLMTESEKAQAEINRLEPAPAPTVMPGVTIPLTEEGKELLEKFGRGELCAITFTVTQEHVIVDKSMIAPPADLVLLDAVKALIPADHPRFVVLRNGTASGPTTSLLVYLCPSACKPREKMLYSSTISSFVAQANDCGVKFGRRLEVDSADEIPITVTEALCASNKITHEERQDKVPPKAVMSKGPRMLI